MPSAAAGPVKRGPSALALWANLGIVYVIWGSTYFGIAIAIKTMPPFLMASVRFALAGGEPGHTWNLFLDQNGTGFFAGSRVSGDLGFVRVGRRTPDAPGTDVISAAGHDVATGEICRGRIRI